MVDTTDYLNNAVELSAVIHKGTDFGFVLEFSGYSLADHTFTASYSYKNILSDFDITVDAVNNVAIFGIPRSINKDFVSDTFIRGDVLMKNSVDKVVKMIKLVLYVEHTYTETPT